MRSSISVCGRWMLGLALVVANQAGAQPANEYEYLVLATSRTSTMEREMNEAAAEGYRFVEVMGGETAADSELVAIMARDSSPVRRRYRVLAASLTSTMQEELKEAGAEGYDYRGQTVYESFFGGEEIIVILERDDQAPAVRFDYELLATTLTSTLERELRTVGRRGFEVVGLTVGETTFGGAELVVITRRIDDR